MNEVNFAGKAPVEAESRGIRNKFPMLITDWEDIKIYSAWIGYEKLIGRYKTSKVQRI